MRLRHPASRPLHRLLLPMCLLALPARPAHAQEVLTNRHVLDLTRAAVEPAVIVSTIESSRTSFTVAVNDIVTLSNARVNAEVIAAMQAAVARSGQPKSGMGPGATATAGLPTEFGMYVVENGESSRMPLVGMTVDDTWTDGRGRPIRRVAIRNYSAVHRKEVAVEAPTFILFQESTEMPRIRMYHLDEGVLDGVPLDTEIPLHRGPAGTDPRMVKLTPGIPLDRGSYLFVLGEDFTRAYGFGRVLGTRNLPSLRPGEAEALARRNPVVQTTLAPDAAKTLVLGVLARERIPVEHDFDADGVLISLRGVRGATLFGTPVAVQFAVVVRPSATGSDIYVAAEAYMAGSPSGWLDGAELADIPLVPAPDHGRRHAEGISREIQRAVRRAR